jgi:dihydroorotate dehydrogenase
MEDRVSEQLIEIDPLRTLAEHIEQIDPYIKGGAGAIIPRSTRAIMERKIHPSPHLYQFGRRSSESMLNAEWTGLPIEYWAPHLERLSRTKQVIMSVSGRDIEGCVAVSRILDSYNFPLIEINVSCAHSNTIHGFITRNSGHIERLIKSLKDAGIRTPLSLKIGHSDFIVELCQVAKEAGVDSITAINTYGPVFDFTIDDKGFPHPVLGIAGGKGGMSGSSIFNIALTDVADIKRQVGIPVLGCGGVRTAEDVLKMMMAGADAVQIYTAAHIRGSLGPSVFNDINSQLIKSMNKRSIGNIQEVKGRAIHILEQDTNLEPIVPEVNDNKCTGCDLCLPICLPKAISIVPADSNHQGHIISINPDTCIGCGHCVTTCPQNAII